MARRLDFPFERRPSPLFGAVHRPIALVRLWSRKIEGWIEVAMLVDTGADFTLLPNIYAAHLGLDLPRESQAFDTMGIGGAERVYVKRAWPMRLGPWRRDIPIGFLTRNDIPPLLGRQACLERFKVTFFRHHTLFSLR